MQIYRVRFLKEWRAKDGEKVVMPGDVYNVTPDALRILRETPNLVIVQASLTWNDESPPIPLPETLNVE